MIDSHCHLADEAFAADLDEVIARARSAGLTGALCILSSDDDDEAERASRVRDAWDGVRFATGVHPHRAGAFAGRAEDASAAARRRGAAFGSCAVGEIGLDYHYDFSPRDVQREVFAAQIALALELAQPVIIHTREASDDTFGLLKDAGQGRLQGVFHCFTGDTALARRALDIGFYISFAGIVTFPRAPELRDAARIVPAERLLTETDSPYLAPVPFRGKRNEPAHVARVVEILAEIRGEPRAALAARTAHNFVELFGASSRSRTA